MIFNPKNSVRCVYSLWQKHYFMLAIRKNLTRTMSVFIQKLNPLAGKMEWEVQDENYDYHQEIARSAFADMLHDTERNQKYYRAIKIAIEKMHAQKKPANVLDIGTGTGLLSMMAVKCGADTVTACETFLPVANCARRIIKANGFETKIKLVAKNSLDMKIGRIGDMPQKANILVTEVFDTELIGEGAIPIFEHAHRELLEEDCIVVPQSATIYAQVVESPLANDWRKIKSIVDTDDGLPILKIPDAVQNCVGSPAVHDIQLNQFPITHFKTIIPPTPVLRFDWSGRTKFIKQRNNLIVEKAEQNGIAQVVFMWWDLVMDPDNKIILSCAPYWAHPEIDLHNKNDEDFSIKDLIPWRDHWMQAVYFLPKELKLEKGQELTLISSHDEYSLWFNLKDNLEIKEEDYKKPLCQCGLHFVFSRTRIGQINDSTRNKKYLQILRNKVNSETVCLCLSEGSLLALIAAQMGAKKVFVVSNMHMIQTAMEDFANHNEFKDNIVFLEDMEELLEKKDDIKNVNLVIGEPHFSASLLPWHNFRFMYTIKNDLENILPIDVDIMPKKVTMHAIACNFYHLYKIKGSLNSCEGFNMKIFDDLIKDSSDKADATVEPQPLWEYPSKALCHPVQITEFDISSFNPLISREVMGEIKFENKGVLNGLALWVDWYLDESPKSRITTGPLLPPQINEEIKWDMYSRQGVYLLRDPILINPKDILHYTVLFSKDDVQFQFRLNGKII